MERKIDGSELNRAEFTDTSLFLQGVEQETEGLACPAREIALARAYALIWLDIREAMLSHLGAEPHPGTGEATWPVGNGPKLAAKAAMLTEAAERLLDHTRSLASDDSMDEKEEEEHALHISNAILSEQAKEHGFVFQVEWEPGTLTGEPYLWGAK